MQMFQSQRRYFTPNTQTVLSRRRAFFFFPRFCFVFFSFFVCFRSFAFASIFKCLWASNRVAEAADSAACCVCACINSRITRCALSPGSIGETPTDELICSYKMSGDRWSSRHRSTWERNANFAHRLVRRCCRRWEISLPLKCTRRDAVSAYGNRKTLGRDRKSQTISVHVGCGRPMRLRVFHTSNGAIVCIAFSFLFHF